MFLSRPLRGPTETLRAGRELGTSPFRSPQRSVSVFDALRIESQLQGLESMSSELRQGVTQVLDQAGQVLPIEDLGVSG